MAFETWDEIEADPRFKNLSPQKQRKAKTLYAKFLGKTQGQEARKEFIQERIIGGKPPAARPELPFGMGPRPSLGAIAEEAHDNTANFTREFVRGVVDNNPAAIVRRGTGVVADAAYDLIAKPTGLPSAKDIQKAQGREAGRLLPRNPESEQSASGVAGAIASGFVDPINLAAPLNVFGKAAPLLKNAPGTLRAANLLPKAAPPKSLIEIGNSMAGAGATNFAIGGATSMAGQALDTGATDAVIPVELPGGRVVEVPKTLLDASLSGTMGAGLGALAPVARRALDDAAAKAVEQNVAARRAAMADELFPARPIDGPSWTPPPVGALEAPSAPPRSLADLASPAAPVDTPPVMSFQDLMARGYRPGAMEAPAPVTQAAESVVPPLGERAPNDPPTWLKNLDVPEAPIRPAFNPEARSMDEAYPAPAAPPPRNLKALVSEEEGAMVMPNPEDVRATVGRGVDLGLDAASAAGRPVRAVDKLVEALLDKPADLVVGAPARLVKSLKDKAKAKALEGDIGVKIGNRRYSTADFVSDNGPAGYRDLVTDIENKTRSDLKPLEAEAARLDKQFGDDQAALYDTVTDRAQTSADAARVRETTAPISRELRDVGGLTEAQYKAFEGEYLPRSYVDKNDPIGGMVRKARATLKGVKHRGKVEHLSRQKLDLYSRDWEVAGEAPDGRVIVRDAATGETRTIGKNKVGDFLGEWKTVGTYKNGNIKAWRDWTRVEQDAMGINRNVSVALRKMARQAYRDLRNGRLLKAISENPEWAVRIEEGTAKPEGWVALDASRVDGDGVYKWGALRDHYVHPAIARDLQNAVEIQRGLDTLQDLTGMRFWKKSKTVWNTVSHMNQVGANMMTLEMAGGSVFDVPDALKVLKNRGELFEQLDELGLYGDSFRVTELADAVGEAPASWTNPLKATIGIAKAVDNFAGDLYQASDDMTRTAYVIGKLREGVPIEQAVKEARAKFYNGNNVNSLFSRVASAGPLPFIKPVLYSLDKIPDLIAENPAKAAKLMLYWMALDRITRAVTGDDDDARDGKQALLPDYQRGPGKVVWTGVKDEYGQEQFIDVQNMNPVGQMLDTTDRSAVPEVAIPGVTDVTGLKLGLPSALMPGGPLGVGFDIASNRDSFRGKDIRTLATNDLPGYLARAYLPSMVTNGVPRAVAAMEGRPDHTGRRYGKVAGALNLFPGLKVQPFNPEDSYDKLEGKIEAQLRELERDMSRLDQAFEDERINEAQYEREMAALEALYDRTEEEGDKLLERADKAFRKKEAAQ